jgi:2-phospho-L-lactate/phosphoenolpyruvate guanylyltransferase
MSSRPAFAVIPIKRFEHGKTRLGELLGAAERAELAQRMFEHVLAASLGCAALSGVLVVSDSPEIAQLARERGAQALSDPPAESGVEPRARLAHVVDAALEHLRGQDAGAALVLMADLPLLRSSDLDQLLAALEHNELVVAPDGRGQCTNALGLRLPATVLFHNAFGSEHSLALHEARARALGLSLRREPNPRLALDIDLPADLDALARSREDG